jgi:putative transposase
VRRQQFIRPGKPVENAFVESFNGKCRDGCLNEPVFITIEQARCQLGAGRLDYNRSRSHSSLGKLTPEGYAQNRRVGTTPEHADEAIGGGELGGQVNGSAVQTAAVSGKGL